MLSEHEKDPKEPYPRMFHMPIEEERHLLDYWHVIVRRKWILITFFCVTVVTTTIYSFLKTPVYQSVCTLRIYKEPPKILGFDELVSTGGYLLDELIRSECDVLQSRSLALRTIKKLNLDLHPDFAKEGGGVSLAGLFSRGGTEAEQGSGSEYEPMIDLFLENLAVEPIRNTQVVKVRYDSPRPELATMIANTLSEEYIQQYLENQVFLSTGISDELSNQLGELKAKLENSEKALYSYAKEYNIIDMGEKEDLLFKNVSILNDQLSVAIADRIKAESRYIQSQEANPGFLPDILESDIVKQLELAYAQANAEYLEELERVQPEHPKAQQRRAKLEAIGRSLREEIEKITSNIKEEYRETVEKEKGFRRQLDDLVSQKQELENKLVGYRILQREVETNNQMYNAILQRMKETALSSGVKAPNVQIVDKAAIPLSPYKPRKKLNILASIVVGLTLGVGLVFFIEYLDKSIKTQEDIEKKLGLVCLGVVPLLKHGKGKKYSR